MNNPEARRGHYSFISGEEIIYGDLSDSDLASAAEIANQQRRLMQADPRWNPDLPWAILVQFETKFPTVVEEHLNYREAAFDLKVKSYKGISK